MIALWLNDLLKEVGRICGVGPGDRPAPPDSLCVMPVASVPKRRLLLVEDDWQTHSTLRKIFTGLGWEVDSALSVAGAVVLLDEHPGVMILDLMLADGIGLEVLRHIRERRIEIRVVVTTGNASRALHAEVKRLRPDALILKPLNLDDLLAALDPPASRSRDDDFQPSRPLT